MADEVEHAISILENFGSNLELQVRSFSVTLVHSNVCTCIYTLVDICVRNSLCAIPVAWLDAS